MGSDLRKLCVVCSNRFGAELTTCPDDGNMLMLAADDGIRPSRLGHVIGNYRLLSVLGDGGVGTVYEAEHVRLGRKVALKLLHPDVVDTEVMARFFNEARAINEIRHANIIEVEDFVTTPTGEHYMLMELLKGEDLRTVMGRERILDPERVSQIGQQVASALAAVHRVNIIHRDLKPDNVFVIQRDGQEMSKLLDFGIAKFTDDQSKGLTRDGMTMGTPQYMAPEQIIAGKEVGTSSDIYALGILMYELLTGVTPFNGASVADILRAHVSEAVEPPSIRRGEPLPKVLEAVVMKCLEKEVEDRFATGDEVAEALRADDPVKLTGRVVTVTRAATQSGRHPIVQPGRAGTQSGRHASQSGRHASQPGRATTQSGRNATPSGRHATQSGRHATESGRHATQAGRHATQSGRHASQSGRHASQPGRAATEPPIEPAAPGPARRPRRFMQMLPALAMAAAAALIHFWPHSEPASASAAPAPVAAPAPKTAPTMIQLSLTSNPAGAALFIGAERKSLGTAPATYALPMSSDPITLIARFVDGHEVTETIIPDGPRDLVFEKVPDRETPLDPLK